MPKIVGAPRYHLVEVMSMDYMDYEEIRKKLEAAYELAPDAESFLRQVLIIWAEYGIIQGDWSCSLAEAG